MDWLNKLMQLFVLLIETAVSFKYLIGLSIVAGLAGMCSGFLKKIWGYRYESDRT